jgi:hypothetical protein
VTKARLLSAAFAVAIIFSPAGAAFGTTLDYTFSGVGTGTISNNSGTTNFTDTAFSVTFVEDTANITTGGAGFFLYNPAGNGTFTEGSYTATFNHATIEVNGNGNTGSGAFETVFLFNSTFGSSIGISEDPTLLGYDLTTPITTGSIPSSSITPNIGAFQDATGFTTAAGDVVQFTALDSLDFTVTSPISATPEPSSLGFLACGGLMIAAFARRRLLKAQRA